MEIAPIWRRGRGLYKLLTGVNFRDGVDLRRQMVEAGGRDGTADEALIKFYSYVAKQENWGPHCIAGHPFLGSLEGSIDVTEELTGLKVGVNVGE